MRGGDLEEDDEGTRLLVSIERIELWCLGEKVEEGYHATASSEQNSRISQKTQANTSQQTPWLLKWIRSGCWWHVLLRLAGI